MGDPTCITCGAPVQEGRVPTTDERVCELESRTFNLEHATASHGRRIRTESVINAMYIAAIAGAVYLLSRRLGSLEISLGDVAARLVSHA